MVRKQWNIQRTITKTTNTIIGIPITRSMILTDLDAELFS
jgi:hypothetical protein